MSAKRSIRRRKERLTVHIPAEARQVLEWIRDATDAANLGAAVVQSLKLYHFAVHERWRGARLQVVNKYGAASPVEMPELGDGSGDFAWTPVARDARARLTVTLPSRLKATASKATAKIGAPSVGHLVTRAIMFYRFALEVRRRGGQLESADNRNINATERVARINLPDVSEGAYWDCAIFGGFPDCNPRPDAVETPEASGNDGD